MPRRLRKHFEKSQDLEEAERGGSSPGLSDHGIEKEKGQKLNLSSSKLRGGSRH
jgi:hypothetical protein